MTARYPSHSNTYVPSWEATGVLVSFTRDPKEFKVADYVQYVNVDKDVGYYLKLDVDQPVRVVSDNDYTWDDGSDSPDFTNVDQFEYFEYRTKRRAYPFRLGRKAHEQADWDILSQHAASKLSQMMTNLTIRVASLLQTASNWPSANTGTVGSLNGGAGKWGAASSDPASANYLAIKKSINAAVKEIAKQTNSKVQAQDLRLVIQPDMAEAMAETSEVHDYFKGSPYAMPYIQGKDPALLRGAYGLPKIMYDVEIVVEDAVKVTTRPGATVSRAFAFDKTKPVLVSRKGGLDGQFGVPSFSTIQIMWYEQTTVEQKDDPDNRVHKGRVVVDYVEKLTAGAAGYLMTDAL